jgi:hypothetical protein
MQKKRTLKKIEKILEAENTKKVKSAILQYRQTTLHKYTQIEPLYTCYSHVIGPSTRVWLIS